MSRPFLEFSALKQLLWQPKREEIAFLKMTSDPSFANFLSCQILRVLTKIYFVHDVWSRLACFCSLVDAKMAGQSKKCNHFKVHPFFHLVFKIMELDFFLLNKGTYT